MTLTGSGSFQRDPRIFTIPIYDEATLEVRFAAELFIAELGAPSYHYAEALTP